MAQTFDPYGNLYASAGTNPAKFGYTGEYQDANKLLFLRARYYDASVGRFFQADPSRQEQNPYLYGLGDPVNRVDPSGLRVACDAQDWGCKRPGTIAIPLVDGDLGMLKYTKYQNPPEDWYGDKAHLSEMIWLTPGERRAEAARLAGLVAAMDIAKMGSLGYYDQPDSSGFCYDCARFVSYILWRVGFRMDAEWNANVDRPGASNSNTFDHVPDLVSWLQREHGAQIIPQYRLGELEQGDAVLYDYNRGFYGHIAMVVKPGAPGNGKWEGVSSDPLKSILMVASRGNGFCGVGDPLAAYDKIKECPVENPDCDIPTVGASKIDGLKIAY